MILPRYRILLSTLAFCIFALSFAESFSQEVESISPQVIPEKDLSNNIPDNARPGESFEDPFLEFADESAFVDPGVHPCLGRWPTFASYVKAGPSIPLGDGFFADDGRIGFALIGGVRESLWPKSGPWFLDFGGGFVTNAGRDATTILPGVNPQIDDQVIVDNEAFTSTLRELRRASVHAAIGFYYEPIKTDLNYELLFSFRVGGRLGHAKGDFERIPDPTTADNVVPAKIFADNDTFLGIFAGMESVLAQQEFFGGDISLVVDAEVANDFIELENLKKAGLPTVSILLGLTIRR